MQAALNVLVLIAGQLTSAQPHPTPAWACRAEAAVIAQIDLRGCGEGKVLDFVQPNRNVDSFFQRPAAGPGCLPTSGHGYLTYDRKQKVPPEAIRVIHARGLRARGP